MRIRLFLTILFLFLEAKTVLAVTVTISDIPNTISDQPFSLNVSVTGASPATNYLRVNLFPTGTTNYFGFTYNGNSYINSSDYSQYFPITIDDSGNWSGTVQAKLDNSSSYFTGPGSYSLKARRYTQSGSSYTWSNEITTLVVELSTPAPSPAATPTLSPSPTSTSSPETNSFTISNAPAQINSDQSLNVSLNLSIPSSPNTKFYLKGAFKKADNSNYFGFTKFNGNWVKNGSTYSDQFPATTDSSGNWSGNLEVKPDSEDSGFSGTGDYIFKVGKYDSTKANPSVSWSDNELTIKIISTETEETNLTNTPSPTIKPTTSPTPSKTTISTSKPVKKLNSIRTLTSKSASVAGAKSELAGTTTSKRSSTPFATPTKVNVKGQKGINPFIWVGLIFIFTGGLGIGYIYWKKNALH